MTILTVLEKIGATSESQEKRDLGILKRHRADRIRSNIWEQITTEGGNHKSEYMREEPCSGKEAGLKDSETRAEDMGSRGRTRARLTRCLCFHSYILGNFSSSFLFCAHQKVAAIRVSGTEIRHEAPSAVAPGDTAISTPPGNVGGGG